MDQPIPRRFRYADISSWEGDTRWELIDGHPFAMSAPSAAHQFILGELYVALKAHFKKGGPCKVMLAPFDVKFSEYDVVQPDLLVSCADRVGPAFHQGAPDLVIEILSPSTMRHDRIRKLRLYASHEVPEYWLVTQHPFMVEVLEFRNGYYTYNNAYDQHQTLVSPRFPQLRLDLSEIAAELPPEDPIVDEVRESEPPPYTAASLN